ncbi:MAG TPA: hypothetical protein DIW44_10710 [Anaerolineaceae bacterium]|nr:hypothetical protein [Anaerolineaceae bacterium]
MNRQIHKGFDYWILIFGIIIYKLPTFLGYSDSIAVRIMCLSPFWVSIFINIILLINTNKLLFDKKSFIIFFLYLCLWGVAVLRSAISSYFSVASTFGNYFIWITFALFGILSLTRNSSEEKIKTYREVIYLGLILYIVVNSVTQLLGFINQKEIYLSLRPAVMLQFVGISTFRVLFPFSSGINSEGMIAGAGLCVSALLFFFNSTNSKKVIGGIGIIFSLYEILLTDSRGALFFAAITIFIAIVFSAKSIIFWRWLPLFTPAIPLFLLAVQKIIPLKFIEALSRNSVISGTEIFSGRQLIWNGILDHFNHFQFIHLFGYGYHGQQISGISTSYSYLFTNFISSELATAHNFLLQTLIELGYIGLIIVFWLVTSLFFSLAKLIKNNPKDITFRILFFLIFFLVLAGTTETTLTPDHQEIFFIFILIWATVGVSLSKKQTPQSM